MESVVDTTCFSRVPIYNPTAHHGSAADFAADTIGVLADSVRVADTATSYVVKTTYEGAKKDPLVKAVRWGYNQLDPDAQLPQYLGEMVKPMVAKAAQYIPEAPQCLQHLPEKLSDATGIPLERSRQTVDDAEVLLGTVVAAGAVKVAGKAFNALYSW